jgi:shikimate kinase
MPEMKIYLIGLPGSGKSTLGKELASTLNLTFVDLDLEIEGAAGKTIKTIFKESGESHFRKLEAETLTKWASGEEKFVMATGGGAPCFFNNMSLINKSGISIFLDVPVPEIIRRIHKTELSERPLLGKVQSDELTAHLHNLHRIRLPFYHHATFVFTGSKISAKDIAVKITA